MGNLREGQTEREILVIQGEKIKLLPTLLIHSPKH